MIYISILLINIAYSILDELIPGHKHVEESLILSAHTQSEFKNVAKMDNVRFIDDNIMLRNKDGEGSIINILKENKMKEWSSEIKIKKFDVINKQKATMSFWYTAEPIKKGDFFGANAKYDGFMAGIEFKRNKDELIMHYNVGLDFKNFESSVLKDEINPIILENLDELIIKVIHTTKNFVIELYDGENLIFDTLRISGEVFPLEKHGKMYFGITTSYTDIPHDKGIIINGLSLYERKENDKYDPEEHFIEHNTFPRNVNDDEINHTIANLDHFMAYVHMVLGAGEENYIQDMKERVENYLKKQINELEKADSTLKVLESKVSAKTDLINENKIKTLEERIDEINKSIFNLNNLINENSSIKNASLKDIRKMIFIFLILIGGLLSLKQLVRKFVILDVTNKKL